MTHLTIKLGLSLSEVTDIVQGVIKGFYDSIGHSYANVKRINISPLDNIIEYNVPVIGYVNKSYRKVIQNSSEDLMSKVRVWGSTYEGSKKTSHEFTTNIFNLTAIRDAMTHFNFPSVMTPVKEYAFQHLVIENKEGYFFPALHSKKDEIRNVMMDQKEMINRYAGHMNAYLKKAEDRFKASVAMSTLDLKKALDSS